jgi:hypothetical protein
MNFIGRLIVALIKLPFVLVIFLVAMALAITGILVSMLGISLVPAFGIGLLILPIGLILLLIANWLRRLA